MIVNMAVMDWIIPPFTTFGTGFMCFFSDVSRMIISCQKPRQKKWVVFRRPSPDGCLRMGRSDTRSPGIGTRYVSASCCAGFFSTRWHHSDCLGMKDFSHATNSSQMLKCKQPASAKKMAYNGLQYFVYSAVDRSLKWIESSTGRGHFGGFCIRPGRIQRGFPTISECVTRKSMKIWFSRAVLFF